VADCVVLEQHLGDLHSRVDSCGTLAYLGDRAGPGLCFLAKCRIPLGRLRDTILRFSSHPHTVSYILQRAGV